MKDTVGKLASSTEEEQTEKSDLFLTILTWITIPGACIALLLDPILRLFGLPPIVF